jgi:nucleotide-binding universal stress UspA family protein
VKTKKILVATDFSATSNAAVALATSLARQQGAQLLIVHVQESPLVYSGVEFDYRPEEPREEMLRQLQEVAPTDVSVPYEHRLIAGVPGPAIVAVAQKENADLIVIATHGRTGISRALMGSVAEEVVRKATCPVLTIKPTATAPSASRPAVACAGSG